MNADNTITHNELVNGLMDTDPHELPITSEFLMREAAAALSGRLHPLKTLASRVHAANVKWWTDLHTGAPLPRNRGEMLMLITSELAEAMEGDRKGLMDDKLPHRPMFEVELADALIRLLDLAEGTGCDLAGALEEKLEYNATRQDHTVEARRATHGKKY